MTEMLLIACGIAIVAGILLIIIILLRPRAPEVDRTAELQSIELNARIQALGDMLGKAQSQLQQTVHERLDAVSQNLGVSMQTSTKHTVENLQKLNERLAVIDNAQKNITDLASQVTSLQHILTNKQARGAFGQTQLESIIADVLPKGAYAFQHTLSNKLRPDCAVFFADAGHLIIDAKFPLEAMTEMRNATNDEERKLAAARVRQDISKHVTDIARYLIPGETQDIALMFIPSESVYADLHERFEEVVQRAHHSRVMIVSPTLMVMAIQVIRQVRKDAQMREAADQIRDEVGHLMKDVKLLGDRVRKLQGHFTQTTEDVNQILISTGKIEKRAGNIQDLEFDDDRGQTAEIIPSPIARKLATG
jgi:DNA recombination protein RmuC